MAWAAAAATVLAAGLTRDASSQDAVVRAQVEQGVAGTRGKRCGSVAQGDGVCGGCGGAGARLRDHADAGRPRARRDL